MSNCSNLEYNCSHLNMHWDACANAHILPLYLGQESVFIQWSWTENVYRQQEYTSNRMARDKREHSFFIEARKREFWFKRHYCTTTWSLLYRKHHYCVLAWSLLEIFFFVFTSQSDLFCIFAHASITNATYWSDFSYHCSFSYDVCSFSGRHVSFEQQNETTFRRTSRSKQTNHSGIIFH